MPIAVKILTIVMPCSLNNVRSLSPSVVSSFKTLFIVSFILFILVRNASLLTLAASNLAALSSSKVFKRAVISFLLISSSTSPSLRFSSAMSLSSSVRFAKLLISSPSYPMLLALDSLVFPFGFEHQAVP